MAVDLALQCEPVCAQLPRYQWRLASQIRRAANSVHANIAEGNGSFSLTDYIKHVGQANKSLRELESHLHFVRRYPRIDEAQTAADACPHVAMLLAGLARSLRKKRERE